MRTILLAATAALALGASAANAATAIYTITGTADGSLNGVAFDNARFTFTLTGDTDNITYPGSLQKLDPIDNASVTIAGFSAVTLNIPTYLSRINAGTETAFNGVIGGNLRNLLLWNTATPVDFSHSFAPVGSGLAEYIGNTFSTTGGNLTIDIFNSFHDERPITISAAVREVDGGGVPEPATWAMMLLGFAGTGAMVRRRRAVAAVA